MTELNGLVTWESIESYVGAYTGLIKIRRLQHIADTFQSIRVPTLLLALKTIEEESLDTATYEKITQALQSCDPAFVPDTTWIRAATKKADILTEKLEQELKAYKNNLIKESIRMGQQDIANHYVKTGQLDKALKALFRNRDYCTTMQHTFEINRSIVDLSLFTGDWQQALTHVVKAEPAVLQMKENEKMFAENHLRAASGLALMSQRNYAAAVDKFQSVGAAIGSSYAAVLTMNDIANFTCLLALATKSRVEILKLSESASFKPFLELELPAREALTAFHKSRYAECFRLLDSIKGNLRADVFFAPHVDSIYELILERSILQFVKSFNLVPLARMAETFLLPIDEMEASLVRLISDGKLPNMRINLTTGHLVDEGHVLRNDVFAKAASMSAEHRAELERVLFHLAVTKAELTVVAPRTEHSGLDIKGQSGYTAMEAADLMDVDGFA